MTAPRTILHLDLDAFYASVEQLDDPTLRGRPVIVGGTSGRGVVCAASYEARKFGVRSAMPTSRARRLCPQAVFLHPRFDRYGELSDLIFDVYRRYTPLVEPLSLDEAFLDVTASRALHGDGPTIATAIRAAVRAESGLTVSAGVAEVKLAAKIATDFGKPDGLTVVPAGGVAAFLAPLPVGRLWGVGEVTEANFAEFYRLVVDEGLCEGMPGGGGAEQHPGRRPGEDRDGDTGTGEQFLTLGQAVVVPGAQHLEVVVGAVGRGAQDRPPERPVAEQLDVQGLGGGDARRGEPAEHRLRIARRREAGEARVGGVTPDPQHRLALPERGDGALDLGGRGHQVLDAHVAGGGLVAHRVHGADLGAGAIVQLVEPSRETGDGCVRVSGEGELEDPGRLGGGQQPGLLEEGVGHAVSLPTAR